MKEPEAIVQNGIVVNHEQLKRYWAERHDREALIRRGMLRDLQDNMPEPAPAPVREYIPRPIVNVRYYVHGIETPAFKHLQEELSRLKGKLHLYFEKKRAGFVEYSKE